MRPCGLSRRNTYDDPLAYAIAPPMSMHGYHAPGYYRQEHDPYRTRELDLYRSRSLAPMVYPRSSRPRMPMSSYSYAPEMHGLYVFSLQASFELY